MKVYSYFVLPIEYYQKESSCCCLISSTDVLPLIKLNNTFFLYSGIIQKLDNKLCVVVKVHLPKDVILEMLHQTTDCEWYILDEVICNKLPEQLKLFNDILVEGMGLTTVGHLGIAHIYGGRNIDELYYFFPELIGLINDIDIT